MNRVLKVVSTPLEQESDEAVCDVFDELPEHIVVEVLVRIPVSSWPAAACAKRKWASFFRSDELWRIALLRRWPQVATGQRWPGPIGRGSYKRRYTAMHVSKKYLALVDVEAQEVAGHVFLYLKEQLELATSSVSYGLLHGTIIDQFLACQRAGDEAQDLASQIWVAVIDNLKETEQTFHLLMRIAEEWEVFLPYPYCKPHAVQWRLFERLFTDFRHHILPTYSVRN